MVAAWHEENVIGPVIENMISSIQYPRSMYHIFIGVYPNDDATIEAVVRLEKRFSNVHMVVNVKPGPTNKADNINNVVRFIKEFERARKWRFSAVTLHDSEDVVDPYELKLTNYLINTYKVLQYPVIPLQRMPEIGNFFKGLTGGTYADEFAEHHFRKIGTREKMSAIVPSAGTGFVISHDILDEYGDEPIFPEDSLTEDYKLSVTLAQKGYMTHFVLEKIPRLMNDKSVRWDYVATRSFFPETFETAVRQKTRWIYGITMQSVKFMDIFKPSKLGIAARYSLYTDLKSKIGNLLVLPGYVVFIYFILSLFITIPDIYPFRSFAWNLCVILTFMMVYRQLMRAIAIYNFYGLKSMVAACLIPPILPIRLVWGNIINMSATFNAWKLYFLGTGRKSKKKKPKWDKTDHSFLPRFILTRYRRNVGDVLIEKKYIDVITLFKGLTTSRKMNLRIGDVLLQQGAISEEQLMEAVAQVRHELFARDISVYPGGAEAFDSALLKKFSVYPLFKAGADYVFATTNESQLQLFLEQIGMDKNYNRFVYATETSILEAIDMKNHTVSLEYQLIIKYFDMGLINWEQVVLALSYVDFKGNVLLYMGLSTASEYQKRPALDYDFFNNAHL
jgi:adsorption protein B